MKSSFRIIALAILVAAFASLSPAMHAQMKAIASVSVPFPFDYGTKHFAPGVYTIRMDGLGLLLIGSRDGIGMAIAQTGSKTNTRGGNQVIFRKYGDRYFLTEVLLADRGDRITVLESKAEKRAAREYREQVMNGTAPTEVDLALLPPSALGH